MKGANGRQKTAVIIGAIATICGVLGLILSSTLIKDWIIIGYGVRAISKIRIAGISLTIFGIVFTLISSIPIMKAARRQKRQVEQEARSAQNRSRVLRNYAQDSANPDFTRRRLEQLANETPELTGLVDRCMEQMDIMDTLQLKQEALIEANDARYLSDTVDVLNNVERRICRNFRNIINLCIAAESADSLDARKIDKYLKDNGKKLSDTKELLKASADWINQYNTDEDSDRSEVENWIAVIRESLKEG